MTNRKKENLILSSSVSEIRVEPENAGALSGEKEFMFGTPSSEFYSVYRREVERKSRNGMRIFAVRTLMRLVSVVSLFTVVFGVFALFAMLAKEGFFALGIKNVAMRIPGSTENESDSIFDFLNQLPGEQKDDGATVNDYSELQLLAEEQLGVLLSQVSDSSAELYRLPLGVAIERITGADVFVSGIREGDIITGVNNAEVLTLEDFLSEIETFYSQYGEQDIALSVYRDGASFSIMCACPTLSDMSYAE